MDGRTLSRSQRIFGRLLGSEGAAAMEAESRAWMLVCPHCGFTRSVLDTGGVRYKARAGGRLGRTCPRCGRSGWQRIEKGPNFPASTGPAWPLVRMILGLVLGMWLALAALAVLLLTLIRLI